MTNNNPLPLTLSSSWGRLSLSVAGLVWVIIFLLGLYKLIMRELRVVYQGSSYFSTFDTRRYLRTEDTVNVDPEDPVGSGGLDSRTVRSLPSVVFRKDEREGGGSDCAICLAEFEEGDWQRVLPSCRHMFHVGCIDTWLRSRSDCPLCRKQVVCDYSSVDPMVRSLELEPLPREGLCGERLLENHSSFSV